MNQIDTTKFYLKICINYRTIIWNYHANLTSDIDKRCIRSQWRIKRMKYFNKRVNVLNAANKDLRNKLRIAKERKCAITSGSLVETSISFEDENKNYTDMCFQTFTSDTISTRSNEIGQENLMLNHSSLMNYTNKKIISNNNEKYEFHNFEKLGILNTEKAPEISLNKDTTYEQSNEISKHLCRHRSSATERPTLLNVSKIDNIKTEFQSDDVDIQPLVCNNMTPNNNELIQEIDFTSITNEASVEDIRYAENIAIANNGNDIETPMSCTTDNFATSSMQSPISLTYNLGDSSPMEISSVIVPSNYTHLITKSSFPVKGDSTFSDLFELAHNEGSNDKSPIITSLSITDVEIIDHISLQAYLEKSIRIPLNVQSRLVNNAIIKYFLEENNLLSHLYSLRSYFFLLNGEFAKNLTDSLYTRLYEISIPIELFNSATLTNLLERALVNSFNNVYVHSELLSLSATDTPDQLHVNFLSHLFILTFLFFLFLLFYFVLQFYIISVYIIPDLFFQIKSVHCIYYEFFTDIRSNCIRLPFSQL